MAHHYIAFASYSSDWQFIDEFYPEAAGSRVTLRALRRSNHIGLPKTKLWIDAEIDGLHSPEVFNPEKSGYEDYRAYVKTFENATAVHESIDTKKLGIFVNDVLNSIILASEGIPNIGYISVPQLPYIPGASRNRINRVLADLSLKWKATQRRAPRMILPIIFAKNAGQTDTKTERNSKVALATACFEDSGAEGTWVVDSTLDDHIASSALENKRFPGVIHFHEELSAKLPPSTATIAGPYWALGLALWARGLVRFPAIGIGRGYQYLIPGRDPLSTGGKIRVAIPPLKRLAVLTPLRSWLQNSINKIGRNDPSHNDFIKLTKILSTLSRKGGRRQIAEFYKDWLVRLESVPVNSRALTLYQDLSAAFVLGSRLDHFDKNFEEVPDPAAIAKQLMVNCL